jgi:hypothetical protein
MWGAIIAAAKEGGKYLMEKGKSEGQDLSKASSLEKGVAAIKGYKELEKDIGGSAVGAAGSSGVTSSLTTPMKLNPAAPGSMGWDNKFYGHYLPSHFKKTTIINTKGRVR